ncbi:MAG: hypothetical protein HYV16_02975 [Gammaproteobacteria bacterium]|nr:hypothetical protein [Gammaproteobacteria bacterium]
MKDWTLLAALALAAAPLAAPTLAPASEERLWWAGFTANWLFFTGISQFGLGLLAILDLCRARWSEPYEAAARRLTAAGAPLVLLGLALLLGLGRGHVLPWLAPGATPHGPWQDGTWLILRHVLAQALYYGVALALLRLPPGPESLGRRQRLAPWLLAAFLLSNTFMAWDFAMMLYPHWHSSVFPLQFGMGSVLGGTAAVLLLTAWDGPPLPPPALRNLGQMLTGFVLLWLYFFWAQFLVSWFGNLPAELVPLRRPMEGGYAPLFWLMLGLVFFLPLASLLFARTKTAFTRLAPLAVGVLLGVWLQRYLAVLPALATEPWLGWQLALLSTGFGGFALLCFKLPSLSKP